MRYILFFLILLVVSCNMKTSEQLNKEAEKLEAEGKFREAIILLDEAINLDPENIYALLNRAVDKSLLEDYKGAIEDYSTVIGIDPDNTLAIFNRGKNKWRLEDYSGSINDFTKAIKTKGGEHLYIEKTENSLIDTGSEFDVLMEEIKFSRGLSYYDIDSMKLAFEDFSFCIQKNYEIAESYYWRGVIYLYFDMKKEGCEDLTKSKELGDPDAITLIEENCK